MEGVGVRVRAGEGRFWGACKAVAVRALQVHVPVSGRSRGLFSSLYLAHVGVGQALRWCARFLWYEPLLRSRCERVGARLRMDSLPYLAGHGRIVIGADVWLSGKSAIVFTNRLSARPELVVGDNTFIGNGCSFRVGRSVRIGRHCRLAEDVRVADNDQHPLDLEARRRNDPPPASRAVEIVVEDDAWIGTGAIILKGVRIGRGAIVGAGSVVSRDVPEMTVVAGNPAAEIRQLGPVPAV